MIKHFPLAVGLLVMACANTNDRIQSMQYFKDDKTGLCFAAKHMSMNNAVMSHVPCTPEVERLIKAGEQ